MRPERPRTTRKAKKPERNSRFGHTGGPSHEGDRLGRRRFLRLTEGNCNRFALAQREAVSRLTERNFRADPEVDRRALAACRVHAALGRVCGGVGRVCRVCGRPSPPRCLTRGCGGPSCGGGPRLRARPGCKGPRGVGSGATLSDAAQPPYFMQAPMTAGRSTAIRWA